MGFLCISLHPSLTSPLHFSIQKIISLVSLIFFLHVLQTDIIYALGITRPDITAILSVSINQYTAENGMEMEVRARPAVLISFNICFKGSNLDISYITSMDSTEQNKSY